MAWTFEHLAVEAWADDVTLPVATEIVAAARKRYRAVGRVAKASAPVDRLLAHAADQFIVAGPTVVAGYPWFGDWSRETFTSYEGLFLCTGRQAEGAALLRRAAPSVSEGMLANTADVGGQPEYNTADATMWFLHALARHIEVTGDLNLAIELTPTVQSIIDSHLEGTRYGIRVHLRDGLVTQGTEGLALTWMDARVHGVPITSRVGKTVEINALWVSALTRLAVIAVKVGLPSHAWQALADQARTAFVEGFITDDGALRDVIDGPTGDDPTLRPNQLIAAALDDGPLGTRAIAPVVDAVTPLLTPLGLRSLDPSDERYRSEHRGDSAARDAACHRGTVWPWPIGSYVEACLKGGRSASTLLVGLESHLAEFGLVSVSETTDGGAPWSATGCPFQAWSVAELIRARQLVQVGSPDGDRARNPRRSNGR